MKEFFHQILKIYFKLDNEESRCETHLTTFDNRCVKQIGERDGGNKKDETGDNTKKDEVIIDEISIRLFFIYFLMGCGNIQQKPLIGCLCLERLRNWLHSSNDKNK